uniref:Phosphatidylinositol-glycan biosynthesis class W protein n=1 Tax=Acrobeloides nanus TaxID=290746 RepID=A0A914EGU4_9BILA
MDDDLDEWTVTTPTGTTQLEVFKTQIVGVLSVFLRNLIIATFFKNRYNKINAFLIDFVTLVVSFLLALTLLANHLDELLSFLALSSLTLILVQKFLRKENYVIYKPTEYLAYFRSAFLLGTVLAILAVDFRVFPRRFAKTESYGYSVMDIGTALFVFSHALSEYLGAQNPEKSKTPFLTIFGRPIPAFGVLFVLGVGRAIVIYLTGYHQEVTEYGVHWNFFITLCCLKIFSTFVPYPYTIPTGLVIGIGYQTALTNGLQRWLLRRSRYRYGLLDENREGIYSLFGYIFLFSLAQLLARGLSVFNGVLRPNKRSVLLIFLTSAALYGLQLQSIIKFGQPSRRLANFPYIFSTTSIITFTLGCFQVIQLLGNEKFSKEAPETEATTSAQVQEIPIEDEATLGNEVSIETNGVTEEDEKLKTVETPVPSLLDAVSKNGLLFFLIANLATGFVNLTISTPQYLDVPLQITILSVYALAISEWIYLYNSGILFKCREKKVEKVA